MDTEDEFFEDFSGFEITDDDLAEILNGAREAGDVRLRRAIKQLEYLRFLFRNIVERSEKGEDVSSFLEFGKRAVK